jgi:hypothetical protein
MRDRLQCEFLLIRYVPDTVKNEFVNIGVVLREAGRPEAAEVRFTRDWSRVRCLDPDADIEMLEALENEIRNRMAGGAEDLLRGISDSFSNVLQVTAPKACLAESLPAEMEALSRMYVETRRQREARRQSGRQGIVTSMRRHFESAGVWALMRKRIAAAQYTQAGDPLRIDCGYRPNGVIRMFQAVSLDSDLEAAKVLAFSAWPLAEGVRRLEQASLELTAVVEPLRRLVGEDALESGAAQDRIEQYRYGVRVMEEQAIRVMTVNDLPRLAERAREELRV